MNRVQPSILTDLILKNKVIKDLAKKCNFKTKFIDKHYEVFLNYADIKLELLEHTSKISLDDLEKYNKLQFKKAELFIHLNSLLDDEILNEE